MISLKEKNNYYCYLYTGNKKLKLINNTACFAGIYGLIRKNVIPVIYIKNFEREETVSYLNILITCINKITPCEVVEINNEKYIKFQLLKSYDHSLLLLNFIRNLWYTPYLWHVDLNKLIDNKNYYSYYFFEAMRISRWKDPIKKLTAANLKACAILKNTQYPGHSNVASYHSLKVKTLEDYLNNDINSTSKFLTT